jgi:hypothetical protein
MDERQREGESMTKVLTRRLASVLTVVLPVCVAAQTGGSLPVEPYTGHAGYQEFRLGPDSWYLAFHGTRDHSMDDVQAAWLSRARQLCQSVRKPYLVELRYVGEPVYDSEPVARADDPATFKVAGPAYIPLFIPSGPRNIPPDITPTKAAPLRCVDRSSGLRAGKRATSVEEDPHPRLSGR